VVVVVIVDVVVDDIFLLLLTPTLTPILTGGESFVRYGLCPVDKHFDNDDYDLKILAHAKLNSYDKDTHGHFFWNFRTEVSLELGLGARVRFRR
jgi:hypothetical protein